MYASNTLIVLLGFIGLVRNTFASGGWTYTGKTDGVKAWSEHFKDCGGIFQSPIDIVEKDARTEANLKMVNMTKSSVRSTEKYSVVNNGHSIMITFPEKMWKVAMDNRPDPEYCAKQLHFHWGLTDSTGSEHTLNGKHYSLEAHLVLYNCEIYDTFDDAASQPVGLAVLGFWGQASSKVSDGSTMFDQLGDLKTITKNVLEINKPVEMEPFELTKLLNSVDRKSYYRYGGSLTTPGCTPNVIWTVFTTVLPVSSKELEQLRNQTFGSGEQSTKMGDNFRPVQPLSPARSPLPRTIYRAHARATIVNKLLLLVTFAIYETLF